MGDEEDGQYDQEIPFQEMDPLQLAAETVWVRFFIREAKKRGYAIADIIALLDQPGMTLEEAAERILSSTEPSQIRPRST